MTDTHSTTNENNENIFSTPLNSKTSSRLFHDSTDSLNSLKDLQLSPLVPDTHKPSFVEEFQASDDEEFEETGVSIDDFDLADDWEPNFDDIPDEEEEEEEEDVGAFGEGAEQEEIVEIAEVEETEAEEGEEELLSQEEVVESGEGEGDAEAGDDSFSFEFHSVENMSVDCENVLVNPSSETAEALEERVKAETTIIVTEEYEKRLKVLQDKILFLEETAVEQKALSDKYKNEYKLSEEKYEKDIPALEDAFRKIEARYSQAKVTLNNLAKTEQNLTASLSKVEQEKEVATKQYHKLKSLAQEKLRRANGEIVRIRSINETQYTTLKARTLSLEFQNRSLQQQLESKTKLCESLSKLLDQ